MENQSNSNTIKENIRLLPEKPGVYQYFDQKGAIIYVGKAKNLKKRVSSYFTKAHDNAKTRLLVRQIHEIRHIVVESETDALLLENNFIKKYQPKYNVLLKDDKSFPWICVKNEPFPRVFSTRNVVRDGSLYYGPYTSVRMVRVLLELIRELYPLRTCNYQLTDANIKEGKFKVCLEYHIGNCLGPCENFQSQEEYDANIEQIKKILRGNIHSVIEALKEKMQEAASNFDFEQAQSLKEKTEQLEKYQSKSTVVSRTIHNVDVFAIVDDASYAYVNFIKVANGSIIQSHTIEMKKKMEETKEELLPLAMMNIRQKFASDAREIVVPFEIDYPAENIMFTIPQRGDKKHLLGLSERNAKYLREERKMQLAKTDPDRHAQRILKTMQYDLRLQELPEHIECFDNSNIQGTHPVAACVVFRHAKPSKKEYRHYNIKTVEGPDDYASMEEVVYRRYLRLMEEEYGLPGLIVIDGGKGQLNAAVMALTKLDLRGSIPIIGIAKRLEEIYFPGDDIPLYLDKNSETLKLVQYLRDEAHRFGITFHRKKRSKSFINSELTSVEGVGQKTTQKLLRTFKSVKQVKNANVEELSEVVGKNLAVKIFNHFHN